MAISSPGLGSNLPVNDIVAQLMAVEARPLQALDRKEAAFQSQLSAFGSLKSALATFQEAMQGLNDANRFQAYKAAIGDSSVATVAATNSAVPGNYSLDVTQLAQAQKLVAMFITNFAKFEDHVDGKVRDAAPSVRIAAE